jgi:hydrogenase maturation protease
VTTGPASAAAPRTLVACVGNVLLGDDGFGVEVAARLSVSPLPPEVRVADFGVRALHLAFELLNPYERIVIVDAMSRGAEPGTLVVLEPSLLELDQVPLPDAHSLHPAAVLRIARSLGARLDHVRIVGCEPAELGERLGLSEPVERAVEAAVRIVHALVGGSPAEQQVKGAMPR